MCSVSLCEFRTGSVNFAMDFMSIMQRYCRPTRIVGFSGACNADIMLVTCINQSLPYSTHC